MYICIYKYRRKKSYFCSMCASKRVTYTHLFFLFCSFLSLWLYLPSIANIIISIFSLFILLSRLQPVCIKISCRSEYIDRCIKSCFLYIDRLLTELGIPFSSFFCVQTLEKEIIFRSCLLFE